MLSKRERYLTEELYSKILDNQFAYTDSHVDKFHHMLQINSNFIFNPISSLLLQKLMKFPQSTHIDPIPRKNHHLQLLHTCDDLCDKCLMGHWVCCYYDTKCLYIFDSLKQRNFRDFHDLHICIQQFLKSLFPYIDEIPIYQPDVQQQTNAVDCALFSMAFATSILFNKNPMTIIYDKHQLRPHLHKMFAGTKLLHFPVISITNVQFNLLNSLEFFSNNKIDKCET